MKKFIFFITLLIINNQLFAHNIISGKIIDKSSSAPLSGVSIVLKGSNNGCVSNEFGNFVLETETYCGTLVFSYLGYKSLEVEFDSNSGFLLISLEEDIIDLEMVNISANRDAALHSIANLDSRLQSVKSSQEVLRMVPGLFIAQHAGGGKSEQIFLRGFDADHGTDINVNVDGIDVNMVSQAHGQGYADLHFLIPELIREIEFSKGPYDAAYGNLATAGSIGFKTKNMLDNSSIKLEGGSFNSMRLMAQIKLLNTNMNHKGKNAYLAIENSLTDGPFNSPQNFKRLNLFAKYNNFIDKNNIISFVVSTFNSSWNQSGQIPESTIAEGLINRWGSLDDSEGGSTSRTNVMAKSSHYIKGGTLSNMAYFTAYKFDLYSNFTFYLNNTIDGDQIYQKEERLIYAYKLKYGKTYSTNGKSKFDIKYGAAFRYDDINGIGLFNTRERNTIIDTINYGNIDETNLSAYADAQWIYNKLSLNLGLRYDLFKFEFENLNSKIFENNAKIKGIISPKIILNYALNGSSDLFLKLGKGFHSNDSRMVQFQDSLNLLPAMYSVDLGGIFKPHPKLIINTALWYSYLEQELVWSGDAGSWEASGSTERLGIDLGLRLQLSQYLFLGGDINWCSPRYTELPKNQNFIPLAPTLTSTASIKLRNYKGFNASFSYRYIDARPADETNTVRTQAYFVSDLHIDYQFSKMINVFCQLNNIFNSDWNEAQFANDYRISPERESQYGLTFTPGNPFSLYFGVKFSF